MASILDPAEPVTIDYDLRGKRASRTFPNGWSARRFYIQKFKTGKHPKVRKPTPPVDQQGSVGTPQVK
jgi:hypothetical protein